MEKKFITFEMELHSILNVSALDFIHIKFRIPEILSITSENTIQSTILHITLEKGYDVNNIKSKINLNISDLYLSNSLRALSSLEPSKIYTSVINND